MLVKNRTRKTVTVSLLLLLALVFSVQSVSAYYAEKDLNITAVKQEKTNWCWAAVSQMAIKYFGTSTTQSKIVEFVKGSIVDKPATDSETMKGLANWGVKSTAIPYGSVPTFSTVKGQIDSSKPILAGIYWTSGGGHYYLIDGYYVWTELPPTPSTYNMNYIDPGNASYNVMSYDKFVSNSSFNWKDGVMNLSK